MVVVSEVKPVWYLLGTISRNKDLSWTQAEKDLNSDHPEFIKYPTYEIQNFILYNKGILHNIINLQV